MWPTTCKNNIKTNAKIYKIIFSIFRCFIEFGLRPTYAYNSSFSPPAEMIIIIAVVDGGPNYNYNFPIPKSNYEYLYYHYQKAISDIGTKIIIFTRIFTTDMFINANLTIFGATATDFPPLSNPLGPKA